MKLDDAITAHLAWRQRLRKYVEDPASEKLDHAKVSCDNCCELGKWLLGDGRRYAGLGPFGEATRAHTQFHRLAGDVVAAVQRGDRAGAQAMLSDAGPFRKASQTVVAALQRLRDAVQAPA